MCIRLSFTYQKLILILIKKKKETFKMANICEYRLEIKGKKEDCENFLLAMPAYDDYDVVEEKGTDDEFTLRAKGTCKWDVYAYVEEVDDDFDYEKARESEPEDLWYIPLKDKSRVYNVEVRISWTDVEDIVIDEDMPGTLQCSYEHWKNGESPDWVDDENLEEFFVFIKEEYCWWEEDEEYEEE